MQHPAMELHKTLKWILDQYHLQNVHIFWIVLLVIISIHYYGVGFYIHWHFYVTQKDCPEVWKTQPKKWASAESIRHSILLGTFNLFITAIFWGTLICYVHNGGWSRVYFDIADYGWTWFFLQLPIAFVYQDYLLYWDHRMFHIPFLYKLTHKVHHRYKQPTPFVGFATHPIEMLITPLISGSLFFMFPMHWIPLVILLTYYAWYTLLDHSGVDLKAQWWQPWQQDTIVHDDHHKYTHCNFGANIKFWDQIHGTLRKPGLVQGQL